MPSTITCKPTVRLKGLTPGLMKILFVLEHGARTGALVPPVHSPSEWVITSINDGQHMDGSRHYSNEAVDLRSRSFPSETAKRRFRMALEDVLNTKADGGRHLPKMFVVLYEGEGTPNEHFHIQVARGQTYVGVD